MYERKHLSRYFLLLIFSLSSLFTQAQINTLSDQYLINQFQVNPGIAGTERYTPITVSTRQQWVGFADAPTTRAISFHSMVRNKNARFTPRGFVNKGDKSFGNIGYGASVFNYSYGAISHTGINLVYAYHVFLGEGRMGFGIAPSFYQFSLNKSGFTLPDGADYDPLIDNGVNESILLLDANVGMHYYDEYNYAGFSIIQLLKSTVQFGSFSFISEDRINMNPDLARTLYAYYGRNLIFSKDLIVEPSIYLKFNDQTGASFHLNTVVHLLGSLSTGLTYRYKESMGLLAGIKLDNLEIRYMFEAPVTSQMPLGFTTHQIMVRFIAGKPIR